MSLQSPKEALQNYFDDLLADEPLKPQTESYVVETVSPYVEQEWTRHQQAQLKQQKLEKLLQSVSQHVLAPAPLIQETIEKVEIQEWAIEISEPAPAESINVAQPESTVDLTIEPALEQLTYGNNDLAWNTNGLPQWAQKDFDVLLFQVSGLTLAVPLISLGQIQPLTDELTPLFGQADWFMGLLPTPTGKVRTVNTAKFVMPERYDESFLDTARYVISIDGVPWGLAVDSVNQPITLKPTDVKWRGERSKRPWLAGTVKEHMCALLDVPMIGQMLMEADRNSPGKR